MTEETNAERLAILETKIDHLDAKFDEGMRAIKELFSIKLINLEMRVDALEKHKVWLWQTLFTTVLGAIITLVFMFANN